MAQAESDVHAGEAFVGIDDDEEKARAIAENDLQGSRKQASNFDHRRVEAPLILIAIDIWRHGTAVAQFPSHRRHLW
jgi:hypothetical protein